MSNLLITFENKTKIIAKQKDVEKRAEKEIV